jgi:hypothetical protein
MGALDMAKRREPDESRGSRPVLQAREGAVPLRYLPKNGKKQILTSKLD